jgi:hypothetical protein
VLRELLDTVQSDSADVAEEATLGNIEIITHRQYQLISLLPNDVLPFWHRLAVAIGRGNTGELLRILDDAGAPPTFLSANA